MSPIRLPKLDKITSTIEGIRDRFSRKGRTRDAHQASPPVAGSLGTAATPERLRRGHDGHRGHRTAHGPADGVARLHRLEDVQLHLRQPGRHQRIARGHPVALRDQARPRDHEYLAIDGGGRRRRLRRDVRARRPDRATGFERQRKYCGNHGGVLDLGRGSDRARNGTVRFDRQSGYRQYGRRHEHLCPVFHRRSSADHLAVVAAELWHVPVAHQRQSGAEADAFGRLSAVQWSEWSLGQLLARL